MVEGRKLECCWHQASILLIFYGALPTQASLPRHAETPACTLYRDLQVSLKRNGELHLHRSGF